MESKIFSTLKNSVKLSRLTIRSVSYEKSQSSLDYCANIVKQHDYENFMATLLLTKALRSPTFVVRAFNVEISKIQDHTTDSKTAAFRLQFWRDSLEKIYQKDQSIKNIPANPVAQELFKVCQCYKIPRRNLEKLITARNNLLRTKYFPTLEDLEKYSDDTVSSIYYAMLAISDVTNVHADHAASHVGKAQGIVNMLRSVFVASNHKMIYIPMDILMDNKVSQESVLRGTDSENMRNVTYTIATRANNHLKKARNIDVPKLAHQILLPAVAIDNYLRRLEKTNFNIFDKSLQIGNALLPFQLYWKRLLNKH